MAKAKLYRQYEQDRPLGEKGMWITDLTIPVKVHAMSSSRVKVAQSDANKKFRGAEMAGNGTLTPEQQDKKVAYVLAHGGVSAWGYKSAKAEGAELDGVDEDSEATDAEGTVLPFSPANAIKLFADLPGFREDISAIIASRETFRKASIEQLKGNSDASSQPTSASAAISQE